MAHASQPSRAGKYPLPLPRVTGVVDTDFSLEQLEARIDDASLDFDPELMRRAGYQVVDWIVERLQNLRANPLGRELDRAETESLLREPMPEEGRPFDAVFAEYAQKVFT